MDRPLYIGETIYLPEGGMKREEVPTLDNGGS